MNGTPQPDPEMGSAPREPRQHDLCQVCGRAVAGEAERLAGRAYPCGLCNEVKLAHPASTGYVYPGAAAGTGTAGAESIPPFPSAPFPPPPPLGGLGATNVPNPGLAALLGTIPGVGAMYNGQYAKGIVHLIVFAILVNLSDANGVFGIFVAGWIFYQAIEAYHTARARRDGTPLPNPFGLNDVGERLGFGKAWPHAARSAAQAGGVVDPAGAGQPSSVPPAGPPWASATPNWGAPWESLRQAAPGPVPFTAPPPPPYAAPGYPPPYTPVTPPPFVGSAPFDPAQMDYVPPYSRPGSRFPAGAIWLIGLGTLFLLNTSGLFRGFNFRYLLPLLFIGLGVWQFVHKMTQTGFGLADDGSAEYRIRFFRAARSGVWLILLGVIFFLADFNILPWSRSWPLFLILGGVMMFLERAVYRGVTPAAYIYPAPPAAPEPRPSTTPGAPSDPSDTATTTQTTEGR